MWDILQQIELNNLRSRQTDAEGQVRNSDFRVGGVEHRISKLELVCQALYELLRERGGMTDEELRRKIREIDLRDGAEDTRMRPKPVHCPKCAATTTAGALYCPQCGAVIAPKYPFSP
ncbi:hypothetical protein HAHE_20900 [Haloferula helveola]|uniref:Zinc ribbon domain-containing protein n=1 Tax=Haloferula helveola TaxID=490095 RepID=A0ABN6H5F8_9BACT|nr:hypothetical protein HAHE_20900 [Haloferula helveola]